jgi:hypothetical protein
VSTLEPSNLGDAIFEFMRYSSLLSSPITAQSCWWYWLSSKRRKIALDQSL